MRVLVAPDAFKGSLSPAQAAEAMAAGIREAIPEAEIGVVPLADGGEGTLAVLSPYIQHDNNGITIHEYLVYDHENARTALVESARCIGLNRPAMQATAVWQRGSGALGGALRTCLDAGIRRFVVGLGGSATNDAGLGMLIALGLEARDAQGRPVGANLQGLTEVAALDASGLDLRLAGCDLTILCDVDAPLCGPAGATLIFGAQKGLSAERLAAIDAAMDRFAGLAEEVLGISARDMPGSGAAGGLGFAFALLGGRLVSGAAYVIEQVGLADKLRDVDWVVTGEGRSDAQTLAGKLPLRVAEAARAAGARVALISGDVTEALVLAGHFDAIYPARPRGLPVEMAVADAATLLRRAAADWAASLTRS